MALLKKKQKNYRYNKSSLSNMFFKLNSNLSFARCDYYEIDFSAFVLLWGAAAAAWCAAWWYLKTENQDNSALIRMMSQNPKNLSSSLDDGFSDSGCQKLNDGFVPCLSYLFIHSFLYLFNERHWKNSFVYIMTKYEAFFYSWSVSNYFFFCYYTIFNK